MSIRFWGLKNCDSCRAALKAIANAGIEVDVSDVRDDAMPADLLSRILVAHGADQVINRRSTTWRGLDEAARNSDPVALLQAHPALMKRPLICWKMVTAMLAGHRKRRQPSGLNKDS